MSAADMKAEEFQSRSPIVPGWRKHDGRLSDTLHGRSPVLPDKAGVIWIAAGRKQSAPMRCIPDAA